MEPDLAAVPQQKIAAAPQILLRLLHCGAANTYDDLGLFWLYLRYFPSYRLRSLSIRKLRL